MPQRNSNPLQRTDGRYFPHNGGRCRIAAIQSGQPDDIQQRDIPFSLCRVHSVLLFHAPDTRAAHGLCLPLFDLFLLQDRRSLFFPADTCIRVCFCHRTVAGCHRGEALPAGTCRAERTDKSRYARLFQIYQSLHTDSERPCRARRIGLPEHLPAGRHLFLRVPVDELHD